MFKTNTLITNNIRLDEARQEANERRMEVMKRLTALIRNRTDGWVLEFT